MTRVSVDRAELFRSRFALSVVMQATESKRLVRRHFDSAANAATLSKNSSACRLTTDYGTTGTSPFEKGGSRGI